MKTKLKQFVEIFNYYSGFKYSKQFDKIDWEWFFCLFDHQYMYTPICKF